MGIDCIVSACGLFLAQSVRFHGSLVVLAPHVPCAPDPLDVSCPFCPSFPLLPSCPEKSEQHCALWPKRKISNYPIVFAPAEFPLYTWKLTA